MPPAAAGASMLIPSIIGAGASVAGGVLSAKSGGAKNVPTTPPNALFPWLNQSYQGSLGSAGPTGVRGLESMAMTGEPVSVGDTFSTMLEAQQRLLKQGRAGLREQFAGQGLMGSSSFRDAAVDFESQQAKDFSNILAQLVLTSGENAANRKLQASTVLGDMFSSAGTAFTPSSTLVTGTPSAAGAGLSSGGSSLTTLALLRAMKVI